MTSFAYIHCKPDGIPFYVGKGALRRVNYLGERNPFHQSIVKKYGNTNILIGKLECSDDKTAFELERGLIKCIKSMEVKLVNFTDGGEGGPNPTPETRKKLSDAAKKRGVSEACQIAKVQAKKVNHFQKSKKLNFDWLKLEKYLQKSTVEILAFQQKNEVWLLRMLHLQKKSVVKGI